MLHGLEHLRRGEVGNRRERPKTRDEIGERLAIGVGQRAARAGELGGDEHAVADRLAVPEAAVLRHRLDRVSRRVAEVQDPAQSPLALVPSHHVGLDPARFGDDRRQRFGRAREDRLAISRDAIEERGARRHPVLDHLVQPGAELAARQRGEHERIDDNRVRLVEGADQVLAQRVVDAHLAADGAVDLREQRGRHVRQRDAAQEARRREARHVANHAAAKGDDRRRAIGVRPQERVVDPRDGRQLLEALAVGHEDRLDAAERARELRAMEPPHERARDDEAPSGCVGAIEEPRDLVDGAVADRHRVGPRRRRHVDREHGRDGHERCV